MGHVKLRVAIWPVSIIWVPAAWNRLNRFTWMRLKRSKYYYQLTPAQISLSVCHPECFLPVPTYCVCKNFAVRNNIKKLNGFSKLTFDSSLSIWRNIRRGPKTERHNLKKTNSKTISIFNYSQKTLVICVIRNKTNTICYATNFMNNIFYI